MWMGVHLHRSLRLVWLDVQGKTTECFEPRNSKVLQRRAKEVALPAETFNAKVQGVGVSSRGKNTHYKVGGSSRASYTYIGVIHIYIYLSPITPINGVPNKLVSLGWKFTPKSVELNMTLLDTIYNWLLLQMKSRGSTCSKWSNSSIHFLRCFRCFSNYFLCFWGGIGVPYPSNSAKKWTTSRHLKIIDTKSV